MKENCMCKIKKRDDEEKKALINRLSRIEGQVKGLRGMVEKDAYCPDILIQSAAVRAAIDSFNRQLLESHIKSCVISDIKNGDEAVADELMDVIKKLV